MPFPLLSHLILTMHSYAAGLCSCFRLGLQDSIIRLCWWSPFQWMVWRVSREQGRRSWSGWSGFGRTIFCILVSQHAKNTKAPSYTSLKLLPLWCDVPNQAFQPISMSFPCRERDGHGNHKAVAVKHKGATRAHPDNWKMKVKIYSVLCASMHCLQQWPYHSKIPCAAPGEAHA